MVNSEPRHPVSRFVICCSFFLTMLPSPSHSVRSNPLPPMWITCQFLWSYNPRKHHFLTICPLIKAFTLLTFSPSASLSSLGGLHWKVLINGMLMWLSHRCKSAPPIELAQLTQCRTGLPFDRKPTRNLKQDNCQSVEKELPAVSRTASQYENPFDFT